MNNILKKHKKSSKRHKQEPSLRKARSKLMLTTDFSLQSFKTYRPAANESVFSN